MRMYIKSIDERAWRSILSEWIPPRTIAYKDGETQVKKEIEWSNDECSSANYNSKALNAISTATDVSMFKLISNCVFSKDA